MRLDVEFNFAAAHRLPRYEGPCFRLHGHNYRFFVGLEGEVDPATGMITDFGVVKQVVQEQVLARADHRDLNDVLREPDRGEHRALDLGGARAQAARPVRGAPVRDPGLVRDLPGAGWPLGSAALPPRASAGRRGAVDRFLDALGLPEAVRRSADLAATPERVAEAWLDDLVDGYRLDPVRGPGRGRRPALARPGGGDGHRVPLRLPAPPPSLPRRGARRLPAGRTGWWASASSSGWWTRSPTGWCCRRTWPGRSRRRWWNTWGRAAPAASSRPSTCASPSAASAGAGATGPRRGLRRRAGARGRPAAAIPGRHRAGVARRPGPRAGRRDGGAGTMSEARGPRW